MGCRTNGVSDQWGVGPMGCRTNGVSDQWVVGPMGCRTNGVSYQWGVGPMGCRTNGHSPNVHTCGPVLELPATYTSYREFRFEWGNLIPSGYDLKMDIGLHPYVPTHHWSDAPLIRLTIGPTHHWSDAPLVRRTYVPTHLCSDN